jgi:hypothetical protein
MLEELLRLHDRRGCIRRGGWELLGSSLVSVRKLIETSEIVATISDANNSSLRPRLALAGY